MVKPGILENADRSVHDYTTQASAIARSLALAVVAIVWLFAGGPSNSSSFTVTVRSISHDEWLLTSLVTALFALTLDAVQYLLGAFLWTVWKSQLVRMLVRDKLEGPPDTTVAKAWNSRAGKRVARILNTSGQGPPGVTAAHDEDVEAARATLRHLKSLPTLSDGSSDPLAHPIFPGSIDAIVSLVFWLKLLALVSLLIQVCIST